MLEKLQNKKIKNDYYIYKEIYELVNFYDSIKIYYGSSISNAFLEIGKIGRIRFDDLSEKQLKTNNIINIEKVIEKF